MGRKSFLIMLSLLVVTLAFCQAIRQFRPAPTATVDFSTFPMQLDDWIGRRDEVPDYVIDLLQPEQIFSATYTNSDGIRVQLFFDYFTSEGSSAGPHSPRNCLPGAGWQITSVEDNEIILSDRIVPAGRFELRMEKTGKVMDFWYITQHGETANDYVFKFYSMLSSLTFRSGDVGFVRLLADRTPEGLAALEEFEQLFVSHVYRHLPFN